MINAINAVYDAISTSIKNTNDEGNLKELLWASNEVAKIQTKLSTRIIELYSSAPPSGIEYEVTTGAKNLGKRIRRKKPIKCMLCGGISEAVYMVETTSQSGIAQTDKAICPKCYVNNNMSKTKTTRYELVIGL